jgi:PBP1b-binding outer membrane lipoprotein LpoB
LVIYLGELIIKLRIDYFREHNMDMKSFILLCMIMLTGCSGNAADKDRDVSNEQQQMSQEQTREDLLDTPSIPASPVDY